MKLSRGVKRAIQNEMHSAERAEEDSKQRNMASMVERQL
jgi:hypothetical protein